MLGRWRPVGYVSFRMASTSTSILGPIPCRTFWGAAQVARHITASSCWRELVISEISLILLNVTVLETERESDLCFQSCFKYGSSWLFLQTKRFDSTWICFLRDGLHLNLYSGTNSLQDVLKGPLSCQTHYCNFLLERINFRNIIDPSKRNRVRDRERVTSAFKAALSSSWLSLQSKRFDSTCCLILVLSPEMNSLLIICSRMSFVTLLMHCSCYPVNSFFVSVIDYLKESMTHVAKRSKNSWTSSSLDWQRLERKRWVSNTNWTLSKLSKKAVFSSESAH